MRLYAVVASANKGETWLICGTPFCTGLIAAEDKKTAKSMLEREYEYMKRSKHHVAKKYFKVVEFTSTEVVNG